MIAQRKNLNGKTTDEKLEELATMVAQGFEATVSKKEFVSFKDEMYEFRDRTDKTLFELVSRVSQLEINLTKLTERVDALTARVDTLTEQVSVLTKRVDTLTEQVSALTARVDTLTEQVSALTKRVDTFVERVDRFVAVIEARETETRETRAMIKDLQARVAKLEMLKSGSKI